MVVHAMGGGPHEKKKKIRPQGTTAKMHICSECIICAYPNNIFASVYTPWYVLSRFQDPGKYSACTYTPLYQTSNIVDGWP